MLDAAASFIWVIILTLAVYVLTGKFVSEFSFVSWMGFVFLVAVADVVHDRVSKL